MKEIVGKPIPWDVINRLKRLKLVDNATTEEKIDKSILKLAEDFYQREISIPLYQSMSDEDVKYIINVITETFGEI